ncbi:MAG TPA: oligosaccharide flippase family protein [Burkholderiales bacterium]|nr:oligosaccharide flippase family protein [Burkholderiales bacterium]
MSADQDSKGAPSLRRLRQRALSLGGAHAFDYITHFLLPVVLARCLDTVSFGQYRLLWLAARTAMALAPLAMPASLYFFLPRSDPSTKRMYINQTLVFLSLTGLISGWAVSRWNPWLPNSMHALDEHGAIVPLFVLLWVMASLLDMLPAIEERVRWQTKAIIGLAALRTVALAVTAYVAREIGPLLMVLVAFVLIKIALLIAYLARNHGLRGPVLRWRAFVDQIRHATPFGAAGALYDLRGQADQWVAAAIFSLHSFASFSVASVIGMLVSLCRKSVNTAFLPGMSKLQAKGDLRGMLDLNSRANVMVGALVCPLAAFAFVFAEEVITIIYTASYLDAAPVMRLYVLALVPLVVELASITLLLRRGPFVVALNAVAILLAVPISWFAAQHFGLAGAAAGSVSMIYLDRIVTLHYISRLSGIPVRRLQDWSMLGRQVLCAALAAAFAGWVTHHYLPASPPWIRLMFGGTLLGAAYFAMLGMRNVRSGFAIAGKP